MLVDFTDDLAEHAAYTPLPESIEASWTFTGKRSPGNIVQSGSVHLVKVRASLIAHRVPVLVEKLCGIPRERIEPFLRYMEANA